MPDAEHLIAGDAPLEVVPGFRVIPTPGHTRGHCVLLYQDRFLFTGDHLWGNPAEGTLGASRSVCWYSWSEQIRSMERLLDYRFEWVLPGHGDRLHLDTSVMHARLAELLACMRQRA
jgi:glyoxylase-like metal-dependent hydrolase (beta-lactamase superfamily II)